MITNYIKICFRIFRKQAGYSLINIFGLAVGLASTMLIALFIIDELSYDRFHDRSEDIYRVAVHLRLNGTDVSNACSGGPISTALPVEVAGIESATKFYKWPANPVHYGEKELTLEKIILADSDFFDVFSFPLREGNPATALKGPNKIILTESTAKAIFGYSPGNGQSPMGKLLQLGRGDRTVEVSGIVKDAPKQSHFPFNVIVSFETENTNDNWLGLNVYTYFKTNPAAKLDLIEKSIAAFENKYVDPDARAMLGASLEVLRSGGSEFNFLVQPLRSIHLNSHLVNEAAPNGDVSYLYLLGAIGLLVTVLATVNFINLSTARASIRAREVGVRKVMGALRSRIVGQFLSESFFYVGLSVLVGFVLMLVVLPEFNIMMGKKLVVSDLANPYFIAVFMFLALFLSLAAGSYPAFYMNRFSAADALRAGKSPAGTGKGIRSVLVVLQFFVSTSLIISTVMVFLQIRFLLETDPGFNRENVVCITNTFSLRDNSESFKNEVLAISGVMKASYSSRLPFQIMGQTGHRMKGQEQWQMPFYYYTDDDYLSTMGLTMLQGRFFSKDFPSDSSAIVLNERAAELFGIKDLKQVHVIEMAGEPSFEVIGIVKDFNFQSLQNEMRPLVLRYGKSSSRMQIRFAASNLHSNVEALEGVWKKHSAAPFEYTFMDESLAALYQSERQLARLSSVLTTLAVIIACLGLLALVNFMSRERSKEIAIRKILGSSVPQVIILLLRHFVILILVSLMIAIPVTWFVVTWWLGHFAYHIDFNFAATALAGIGMILLAVMTVGYQTLKTARNNPVNALRSE